MTQIRARIRDEKECRGHFRVGEIYYGDRSSDGSVVLKNATGGLWTGWVGDVELVTRKEEEGREQAKAAAQSYLSSTSGEENAKAYMDGRLVATSIAEAVEDMGMKIVHREGSPFPRGSKAWQADVMRMVFEECQALREAGQKEYAHDESNAFENFEADAKLHGVSRETSLMIFMTKHIRGIASWVKGHRSQRESVKGRINDAIVYLTLLRGMVEQEETQGE